MTDVYVVTRAPMDAGNMALSMPYFATDDKDKYGLDKVVDSMAILEQIQEQSGEAGVREFTELLLRFREPVFQPGEILYLADGGREVLYPGRKPDKWDVDIEFIGDSSEPGILETALEVSRRITDELNEAGNDPEVLDAIRSIKNQA